jgi:hypothetical protein
MYWDKPGGTNTIATTEAALSRAAELNIKHIVIASRSGRSAEFFLKHTGDFEITCVTHQVGYIRPGEDEMSPETRKKLIDGGVMLLTTTHLMAGIDRACRNKFGGIYPSEIAANTLRMLGQGLKVCVEVGCMALDGGLIPYGTDIVSIGGSGRGLDTAVVLLPAHSQNFFDTKVKEIICKPREF